MSVLHLICRQYPSSILALLHFEIAVTIFICSNTVSVGFRIVPSVQYVPKKAPSPFPATLEPSALVDKINRGFYSFATRLAPSFQRRASSRHRQHPSLLSELPLKTLLSTSYELITSTGHGHS
jgi:hypothetical protein